MYRYFSNTSAIYCSIYSTSTSNLPAAYATIFTALGAMSSANKFQALNKFIIRDLLLWPMDKDKIDIIKNCLILFYFIIPFFL